MSYESNRLAGPSSLGETAIGLGTVFAVLVAITIWSTGVFTVTRFALSGANDTPLFLLVGGFWTLLGPVLGTAVYAHYRDIDISTSLPTSDHVFGTALALIAPVVVVGATSLVGNVVFGVSLGEMVQQWTSPNTSIQLWATIAVPSAIVAGLGYGVLFCGVVYEGVRDVVGDDAAVGISIGMVAVFWLLPIETGGGLRLDAGWAFEAVVSLVFGVAFSVAIGILYRRGPEGLSVPSVRSLTLVEVFVIVIALLGLLGIGTDLVELPRSIGDLLWVVALAIAVVGYDRTRSFWIPVLSITVFSLAIGAGVYIEAVYGLTAGP